MNKLITIDGTQGVGGGQILRTSLSLSAITQTPFRMVNVRAKREVPGLKRQHLTCVRAVAEVCGAQVEGDEVGSIALSFSPGPIRGGEYRFDVGTAGSATLVAQTVLPVLLMADIPSSVTISGGTHVQWAPIWEFFAVAYLPQLRAMGAEVETELVRHGFYPAAGGEIRLSIKPFDKARANKSWSFTGLGDYQGGRAVGIVANIPRVIAENEAEIVSHKLLDLSLRQEVLEAQSPGPGNCCFAQLDFANASVVVSEVGSYNRSRKAVANGVVSQARRFLKAGAAAEEHLADQLLVPLAALLGRHGDSPEELGMTIEKETLHYTTNRDVIGRFI